MQPAALVQPPHTRLCWGKLLFARWCCTSASQGCTGGQTPYVISLLQARQHPVPAQGVPQHRRHSHMGRMPHRRSTRGRSQAQRCTHPSLPYTARPAPAPAPQPCSASRPRPPPAAPPIGAAAAPPAERLPSMAASPSACAGADGGEVSAGAAEHGASRRCSAIAKCAACPAGTPREMQCTQRALCRLHADCN